MKISHTIGINLLAGIGVFALWWYQQTLGSELLVIDFPFLHNQLITTAGFAIAKATQPAIVIIAIIIGGFSATYDHHTRLWWLFSILLLVATAASELLKEVFMIPRPEVALVTLSSFGFPSTHATVATVLLVTGLWFYHQTKSKRPVLTTAAAILIWLVICISRLILVVHSEIDILAGILLGLAISAVAISVGPHILARQKIQKKHRAEARCLKRNLFLEKINLK